MKFKIKRFVFILPVVCLLAACGKGLDRKLDTTGNDDAFNSSFWEANKDMSAEDKDAWSWAVNGSTINDIRAKYPDATLRQVIRGEARDALAYSQPRIKELEPSEKAYDEKLKSLRAITASNVSVSFSKDSKPHIEFDLHNGGQLPVSELEWKAWLYVDDNKDPVASAFMYDHYEKGLVPGASAHRQYADSDIIGSGWDTLAVRNAKSTRIVVELDPFWARDYSDKRYMEDAPYDKLKSLREMAAAATKYAQY